jgi:carbon-monoxide dehydrogenase medium subunit
MLKPFAIHTPTTLSELFALRKEYGPESAFYAGGTELLLVMQSGFAHYPHLIDVKRIPQIAKITLDQEAERLRIGAGATHRQIETSSQVREHAPLLAEVEKTVANIRVRVMGTLGGNLCFAEPHSDPATLFMAWEGARFELISPEGGRQVAPEEFFLDLFTTARQEDEIMSAIHLPVLPVGIGRAYHKFVTLERPTVNVATFLNFTEGKIENARLAVGCVGPVPVRARAAEQLLIGAPPDEEQFMAAAEAAAQATDPVDDMHGSRGYKRQIVRVITRRALGQAAARALASQ